MQTRTYLDYNATAPLDSRVLEAMMPFLSDHHGNPSATHIEGREVRTAIENARRQVASAINARPDEIIFTASGTESNNTIIRGVAELSERQVVAIGSMEHPCALCAGRAAVRHNKIMLPIAADEQGSYDLTDLATSIDNNGKKAALISLMLANNETGVIQDIAKAATIAKNAGVVIHTDAAQALGKIPVNFAKLGVDAMTLSAHKARGPKGVAALIVKNSVKFAPLLEGGGQESGRRSSTENVAGIIGFGKAAELAAAEVASNTVTLAKLRDDLEARLIAAGAVIFGSASPRMPNCSYFAFSGIDGEMLVSMLDQSGYAVASGAACANLKDQDASHVLLAMGIEPSLARCAVRTSIGPEIKQLQIEEFTNTAITLVQKIRSMSAVATS